MCIDVVEIWFGKIVFFFSLLMNITIYGLVKTSVRPLFIFLIIFLLDFELNFICNLLLFRWELIVLVLLQICFFFVMREILNPTPTHPVFYFTDRS